MEQVILTQVPIADLKGYIAHAVKEEFAVIRNEVATKAPPQYRTRKEAAAYLRLSLVTLHEYTLQGRITAYRIGARVLYLQSDLDECLSKIMTAKHRAA